MTTQHDAPVHVTNAPPHTTLVTSWMTVGEARAALVTSGQRSLPVVGHDGLIGLITIEAVSGLDDADEPPDAHDPVLSVMDWHLVQLPPGAGEREVVHTYTEAAWTWLRSRSSEVEPPGAAVHDPSRGLAAPAPHPPASPRRRPLWWMG